MATKQVDVVVVGAGISGLTAARQLLKKDPGLQIVVLEGKDRVGGRTQTVPLKAANGTESFDVGGQWVGRSQIHIMDLLDELGLKTHEQYREGKKVLQIDNKINQYDSEIPTLSPLALFDLHMMMTKLQRMSETVDPSDPYSCPDAEYLDSMTFKTFIDELMWTKAAKETAKASFRCVFGIELNQVSALYILLYIAAAGSLKNLIESTPNTAQEFTIQGGAQQISCIMADHLGNTRVLLQEGVVSIEQKEAGVLVKTVKDNTYECKKVILAVPPQQIGKIAFDPQLPTVTKEIIKRMPTGNLTKVIVTYKTAFWREAGFSGQVVTNGGVSTSKHCCIGPLCIVFDDTTANGNPALLSFIGGASAIAWRQETEEARKSAVLKSLSDYFGAGVYAYLDYIEKDWHNEPYTEGSPVSVVGPGAMEYFASGLRKPFNRVHFAGTESATVWCGFMSGAVQAGRRAALEVLLDLRPQVMTAYDIAEVQQHKKFTGKKSGVTRKIIKVTIGIGLGALLVITVKKAYDKVTS